MLSVQAAIGCAEQECLAPIPGRVITDSEPKISRAPDLPTRYVDRSDWGFECNRELTPNDNRQFFGEVRCKRFERRAVLFRPKLRLEHPPEAVSSKQRERKTA